MRRTLGLAAALLLAVSISAEEHVMLGRLKPLIGTWETHAKGTKIRTTYELAAKGTAIVEVLMPDSERMTNVIHADGDTLLMSHYCSRGSQPRYRATSFDGNTIVFSFVDGTNLGTKYMKGVKITLEGADHLVQEWTNHKDGKDEIAVFRFTRVK